MADRARCFVTSEWLADHCNDPEVAVVDARWYLPDAGRDAGGEFLEAHIPGAVYFDIDAIADQSNPLPHMLPSPEAFAAAVGSMGIDERQKIVVYDAGGLGSAPRVWWTFRIMGASDVSILQGGFQRWKDEGRPTESGPVEKPPRRFNAAFTADAVRNLAQVRDGLATNSLQLVDARPLARFLGEAPEPRPWVKSGRIPGSLSLPSTDLASDGTLKDEAAIREAFAAAGVDLNKPVVTSCGSGVTAAVLSLALETIGFSVADTALYDGSWTEWGGRDDTEIATGPITKTLR